MKYKDIIRLKFPTKNVIKFIDNTYAGIIWNQLDETPNPTEAELDAAILSIVPVKTGTSQTLLVVDAIDLQPTNSVVIVPSAIFINGFASADVGATSGTAIIPFDSSTPAISEGSLLASVLVTPRTATSKVKINFSCMVDSGANNRNITLAVFRNSVCIGTTATNIASSGKPANISIDVVDTPNSSANITYSLRAGTNSSGTWYINRTSSGITMGGATKTTFMVTEFE